MNTVKYFLNLPFKQIPFEEKTLDFKYACLNVNRSINANKSFLKYFNISDIKQIGASKYSELNYSSSLSEFEILNEYNKCKFILSFSLKKPSLTWDRRRILFAMLTNGILLTNNYDAKYLGEPFILDKSIFTKSNEELKNIALNQKEFFFSHLKSENEIKNTLTNFME